MSNGIEGNMWKSGASKSSTRLTTLRSLVPPAQRDAMRAFFDRRAPASPDARSLTPLGQAQDRKISWREWAGDKLRGRVSNSNDSVEKVSLFPGWAARRYHDPDMEGKEAAEFALEVFISGFAASYVPPESATRSQRAFMRLAKAYAALPKIPSSGASGRQTPLNGVTTQKLSKSTEDLLKTVKLPPTPESITEETEIAALERHFQKAELDTDTDSYNESDSSPSSGNDTPPPIIPGSSSGVSYATASGQFASSLTDLARLHDNLSARLQPFWSRSLPNRPLRLSIYSSPPRSDPIFANGEKYNSDPSQEPIFVHNILTGPQGAFEANLRIPWESMCIHPGALHVAFGGIEEDAELFVCAELLPPSHPAAPYAVQEPTTRSILPVTLSQTQIRLISDIDDTIKLSNILGGARAVFQNVFVKHLEELVISGMGDWYTQMWSRGVRFHYVSNSPFELLPVINEFIKVSNLPRGSVKLRSYAGRSLFNGLLSTPATRKRTGILEILNAFSGSRFFLVGDSGEQDLELYSLLAAERHSQILGVFIRDARGPEAQPIVDPTGEEIKRCPPPSRTGSYASSMSGMAPSTLTKERNSFLTQPSAETTPTKKRISWTGMTGGVGRKAESPMSLDTSAEDYWSVAMPAPRRPWVTPRATSDPAPSTSLPSTFFDSGPPYDTTSSPTSSRPSSPASSILGLQFPGSLSESEVASLPPAERKRYKLQERVYRARLLMPSHIPLRVFVNPEECVETGRILDELTARSSGRPDQNRQ
ncbi:uncharacterized protein FOMMEDRAFT_164569 [Fomitiporia mediterranea MF3/22]|uniref:uncharacterized protein n=1 Tax=Fomitiporia mediterranea (strain MF3/22) TaxID=694068 RepID=UPI0004409032|nr:uncharacterized protein FOMMEDRAFT_164569 [Fomitiporia mediterranea MF3/22]EJD07644.1 hypothetical protein FOMMEDRAFT_164569 [Fomitiporia mediterranea MF3/22]